MMWCPVLLIGRQNRILSSLYIHLQTSGTAGIKQRWMVTIPKGMDH